MMMGILIGVYLLGFWAKPRNFLVDVCASLAYLYEGISRGERVRNAEHLLYLGNNPEDWEGARMVIHARSSRLWRWLYYPNTQGEERYAIVLSWYAVLSAADLWWWAFGWAYSKHGRKQMLALTVLALTWPLWFTCAVMCSLAAMKYAVANRYRVHWNR